MRGESRQISALRYQIMADIPSANTQKFATMLPATKVFVGSARSFALYLSNQTVVSSVRILVHP